MRYAAPLALAAVATLAACGHGLQPSGPDLSGHWRGFATIGDGLPTPLDMTLADDLDWAIRGAFFAESRCVSMRHVLLDLAERVGLTMDRFERDFDSGQAKELVIAEAREGWERLKAPGSPTLVLPTGMQVSAPAELGLPEVEVDERGYGRVTGYHAAPCAGADCLTMYRRILDQAVTPR